MSALALPAPKAAPIVVTSTHGFALSAGMLFASGFTGDEWTQIIIATSASIPATIAAVATLRNRRKVGRRLDQIEERVDRRRIVVTRGDTSVTIVDEELEDDDGGGNDAT